jgi:hypothetical protein
MKLCLLIVSVYHAAESQFITLPRYGMQTVMSGYHDHLNMYVFGDNTAWLLYDENIRSLEFVGTYDRSAGEFRRPFDPGTREVYQYFAQGAKKFDGNHAVAGQFGFSQDFRSKWQWMATRDYDTENPFLLADSSTGRTVYRGIVMSGQYSARITERLLIGTGLHYAVSNGLKEVTPKPTSTIRDLSASIGTAYRFSSHIAGGLSFRYDDQQEEISYREDEVDPLTETILFKFRGYDRYLRISKKTEFRENRSKGYRGTVHASGTFGGGSQFVGFGSIGSGSVVVRDGGTSPDNQGTAMRESIVAGLRLRQDAGPLAVGLQGKFGYLKHWALHPNYDVMLSEGVCESKEIVFGIERNGTGMLRTVAGEYMLTHARRQVDDYLSNVYFDYARYVHTVSLGTDVMLAGPLRTRAVYSYRWQKPDTDTFDAPAPSSFFNSIRIPELDHYRARTSMHGIQIETGYATGRMYEIVVGLTVERIDVRRSEHFADDARTFVGLQIALRGR